MYLKLKSPPPDFPQKLKILSPWTQPVKFNESSYAGFYPTIFDATSKTFCTAEDTPETVSMFKEAYTDSVGHQSEQIMPNEALKTIFGPEFSTMTFLDAGCNDGMKSLHLKQIGAGYVKGIEYRAPCIKRAQYIRDILNYDVDFEHVPIDAEDPDYATCVEPHDIVCSYGIAHHLEDHLQYIENLRQLTRRALILMTSHKGGGKLEFEDPYHPYKSFKGQFVVPSKDKIMEYLGKVGFRLVLDLKFHPKLNFQNYSEKSRIDIIAFV